MLRGVTAPSGKQQLPWRPADQGTALIAVARSMAEAEAAVSAGAGMVDLGAAGSETIIAVRSRFPGIGVCAAGQPADVISDVAAARANGALAICHGIDAAHASGLPATRLLVEVPPQLVPAVREQGWLAVVDADRAALESALAARRGGTGGDVPGDASTDDASTDGSRDDGDDSAVLAIAAVSSWLGADAVRTRHVASVRRSLDMTATIRGLRPPARAVRGLA
jgi:hypothetical protein